jgi:hypothetical protein
MANSTVECREWGTGNHPRDGASLLTTGISP